MTRSSQYSAPRTPALRRLPNLPELFIGMLICLIGCAPERPSLADEIDSSQNIILENPTCEVPGNPANWLAAYCMWMNGVSEFDRDSDEATDPVKQCIKTFDRHQSVPRELCKRNRYFKEQICENLRMAGVYQGSVTNCISSRGTVPRVVREGL